MVNSACVSLVLAVSLHAVESLCPDDSDPSFVYLPDYGCIRGKASADFRAFFAVPFATPPTIENGLRFANPTVHNGWQELSYLNTTSMPPPCVQACRDNSTCELLGYSEDCLYVNVWTPVASSSSDGPFPVMLWFYGGSYNIGFISEPLYNGQNMAQANNVIVVTLSYRIGALGFLYSEQLGFEGNYGYYDQLFGINWVYDNIEYFGGDKKKITLFGESAGGMSVATVLFNYGADSQDIDVSAMYNAAIIQSSPFGVPLRTTDDWDQIATDFIATSGCADASDVGECLRTTPTSAQLLNAQNIAEQNVNFIYSFMPWTPTLGTDILPQDQPIWAFKAGEFNRKVPVMLGFVEDETQGFVEQLGIFPDQSDGQSLSVKLQLTLGREPWGHVQKEVKLDVRTTGPNNKKFQLGDGELEQLLASFFGTNATNATHAAKQISEVKTHFNVSSVNLEFDDLDGILDWLESLLVRIGNSLIFVCPTRKVQNFISSRGRKPVYGYNFNYWWSDNSAFFSDVFASNSKCAEEGLGIVCHAGELGVLFYADMAFSYDALDTQVSEYMQTFWTNMAILENPGEAGDVEWQEYKWKNQVSLVFNSEGGVEMQENVAKDNFDCNWWDLLGYFWLDLGGLDRARES